MFYEIYQWLKELERRLVQESLTGEDAIRRDVRKADAMARLELIRGYRNGWVVALGELEEALKKAHAKNDLSLVKEILKQIDEARDMARYLGKEIVEIKREWFLTERDPRDPE